MRVTRCDACGTRRAAGESAVVIPAGEAECLAIMAKAPRPNVSKTRLIPALGADGAARIARAMLEDTCRGGVSLQERRPTVRLAICFAPEDAEPEMRAIAPATADLHAQRGVTLGQRLSSAFDDLFGDGDRRVVIIGADSPTLPVDVVEHAFDRLRHGVDVVIGPTRDGGYYLIGLRRPASALFVAIPWSTSRVLAATLDRAAAACLTVELLPEWYDIDDQDDLEHLQALFASGDAGAPATRAALAELRPPSGAATRIRTLSGSEGPQ